MSIFKVEEMRKNETIDRLIDRMQYQARTTLKETVDKHKVLLATLKENYVSDNVLRRTIYDMSVTDITRMLERYTTEIRSIWIKECTARSYKEINLTSSKIVDDSLKMCGSDSYYLKPVDEAELEKIAREAVERQIAKTCSRKHIMSMLWGVVRPIANELLEGV